MNGVEPNFEAAAASALRWWADAGVDCLVADAPRNWLAETVPVPPPSPERAAPAARAAPPAALELPDQLALFHEWLRSSDALPLAASGAPRICPSGDPASGLAIFVAMPSSEDCSAGTLLSGAAGGLFDRMLAAIGRSRETIYLAGLSCLRPASGRLDAPDGAACADIARHNLGLLKPKAVLLLGDACVTPLLGLGVGQARGRVHDLATPAGPVRAVASLHPDLLLARPALKRHAWADLLLLKDLLA